MRVLFVASECFPYLKTGGLADVIAALPAALHALGMDVRILLPGYPGLADRLRAVHTVRVLPDLPGGPPARLLTGLGEDDITFYVLDAPSFFARDGNPYLGPDGRDWPDNHLRFGALSKAAAQIGWDGDGEGWRPDVVHAHDWQAGLTPAFLALGNRPRPASILTVHNLAFQGLFPPDTLHELDLPLASFSMHGMEFHGKLGFLKAGLYYADRLTTVSPTYAREIQGPEMGFGLDGLLRGRAADLVGILNGVDVRHWDPATDRLIGTRYDANRLDAKAENKAGLQQAFGLRQRPDALVFGLVSRLTHQKGIDLLLQALPRLLELGGQLVILGTGSPDIEEPLAAAARDHAGHIGLARTYDETLSHRIQAGADVTLVPSRFEPCGLTQMYALRYGTLPLVSEVGGLADTVVNVTEGTLADGTATGFVFEPVELAPLLQALDRAATLWSQPELWRRVQHSAMSRDVGWASSARQYAALYRQVRAEAPGRSSDQPMPMHR